MATIARGLNEIFPTLRGAGDRYRVKGLVRVIGIVEFNSGVK